MGLLEPTPRTADWYRRTHDHASARADQFHGSMWRALREAIRFPSLRYAFTDTWGPRPGDAPLPPVPTPTPSLVPLGPITASGRDLFMGGRVYVVAGTDGQRDYQMWLDGRQDELRQLWQQARDLGSTSRLVWGMFGLGSQPASGRALVPQEHANYYSELQPFAAAMAAYGQSLVWVWFANTQTVMPDLGVQLDYYNRCNLELAEINAQSGVLGILVNEGNQHDNWVDAARFAKPNGFIAASGSNGAGQDPPIDPKWDVSALHSERNPSKPGYGSTSLYFAIPGYAGENGQPGFDGTQHATIDAEGLGFDVTNQPGRRTNDIRAAYELGCGTRMGNGGIGHSTQGLQSQMLPAPVDECVRQYLRGVKGLPFGNYPG